MNEIFDKEEWASRKQQDREAAYAMVDDTLKKMGTNGKAFQTYLDVQSKFERYSVSNALLVAAQKPEATDLGDANFWRGRGGYIRKGESGILLMEPGNSYTRKDGSKGVNIHIKRVFDISQTTLTPTKQPAVSQDTRLLLNAMVRYAPCKVDFRDELPDGQSALYSPQEKTVFVRRGQSMEDVFRGVAQELAHAYLDTGNYSRENNIFLAQCVGNILCQRNGIDGKSLAITQLPQKYAEMEPMRRYIQSKRREGVRISYMALILAAYFKAYQQNPKINRFIMNSKIYQRNHFCVSFVILKTRADGTPDETSVKIFFEDGDDVISINRKIEDAVALNQKKEHNNNTDRFANFMFSLPVLPTLLVGLVKLLDRLGLLPRFVIDLSPFHTSLFITNLASINTEAIYHHCYEFGTTGVFVCMGKPVPNFLTGEYNKKIMPLGIVMDERICTGHEYALFWQTLRRYLKHPELTENGAEERAEMPEAVEA